MNVGRLTRIIIRARTASRSVLGFDCLNVCVSRSKSLSGRRDKVSNDSM